MLLLLILIGLVTYFVVRWSVASITRTPVWLLWVVIMTPATFWTLWVLVKEDAPMPPLLLYGSLFGSFIVCPLLYWFLVQRGRPTAPVQSGTSAQPPVAMATAPTVNTPATPRPINKEEEASLQNCFPWSIYYLQNIEYRPQAMICRGQLRTSPEVAYKTVQENVEATFRDRFLVVFQEGLNGKPFFALVPNANAQPGRVKDAPLLRPGLAIGLLLATLLTTTLAGALFARSPQEDLPQDFATLLTGLPYALALMAILGLHELGHYLVAVRYKIRATLPYFIPVPPAAILPFGTLGAFIQLRSPVPNRKALFDVSIAGPLSGFVVTIPLLLWGLAHSTPTQMTDTSSILNVESFDPAASLLLLILSKLALGGAVTAETALNLHPVAVAGCLGLVFTASNLLPVGQLDGGHIVHAMFGQRSGAMIGQVARLLFLGLSFVQKELFIWAFLLFFMPIVDEPALNDVTELDNGRDLLGLLALALLIIIILPAPQALTNLVF